MDHTLYSAEDFACDPSYLRYFFRLAERDIAYWEEWIRLHPEKMEEIISADQLITFLSVQLPEEEQQQEYDRLMNAIEKRGVVAAPPASVRMPTRKRVRRWMAAAVILLVFVSGGLYVYRQLNRRDSIATTPKIVYRNDTDKELLVSLADGSQVHLSPGSGLSMPEHFLPGKREVHLTGTAFFDVTRSPRRPFYVYCSNLVTHVLGTSFLVSSHPSEKTIEVAVRSGKVEVYEGSAPAAVTDGPKNSVAGLVLTPNQKGIYRTSERRFDATLVDQPMPVIAENPTDPSGKASLPGITDCNFRDARLQTILQQFQSLYKIDIDVDNDAVNDCHFTGDVTNMNLYEKLDVICQSTNAHYEIRGTRILIRGAGCE